MDKLAYTVTELAATLGIGKNAAYELTQREGFPAVRVSERRIVIPRDSLKLWLERQAEHGDRR